MFRQQRYYALLGVALVTFAIQGKEAIAAESAPLLKSQEIITVVFEPVQQAVLSAQVSAKVKSIRREMGQVIKKGELLLALDEQLYRAKFEREDARLKTAKAKLVAQEKISSLNITQSKVRKAEAILQGARSRLKALENLYADKTVSLAELEKARTDAAVAEAEDELAKKEKFLRKIEDELEAIQGQALIKTAAANLAAAKFELDACSILAPFSGRVSEVFVHPHESVRQGRDLIEVVDDSKLLANFLIPSSVLPRIKIGQEARIQVKETGKPVTGMIRSIEGLVDPTSSTVKVAVLVNNTDGVLRGGMRGSIVLQDLLTANKTTSVK